jgi:tetratricopeptide (TPR) repeat protein
MAKDPRAFLQLAEEHRRSGRLKEAIAVCLEGLGRHPGLDAARITLGRTYLEAGQPEIARSTLEEVFARQPEHHLAGKLLAEAQQQLGDMAAAAATCRDLLRHYPRDREIEAILEAVTRSETSAVTGAPSGVASGSGAASAIGAAPGRAPQRERTTAATPPQAHRPAAPPREADPAPEYMPEDVEPRAGMTMPRDVTPAPAARASAAPAPSAPRTIADPKQVVTRAPAPPPAAAPPSSARPAVSTGGDVLQTSTLADLYLRQGLVDRAIEVYRAMLRVDPANQRAKQRLAEIESGVTAAPAATPSVAPARGTAAKPAAAHPAAPPDEGRRQAIARLEEWLDTIRRGSAGAGRAGK